MDSRIRLRPAREEDCKLFWEWANDPETRKFAFNKMAIAWDDHVSWFSNKIHDPDCRIYVAENDTGAPLGQARFDITAKDAEIDVSIDRTQRGSGLGAVLIDEAVKQFFSDTSAQKVHAYILPENHASIAAFEKASFQRIGIETKQGTGALHYAIRTG